MARFNVVKASISPIDLPVSGTFTWGTPLGRVTQGNKSVWAPVAGPIAYRDLAFVTVGQDSDREDVKMLGVARLIFGEMLIETDQTSGTLAVGDMVAAGNGKLYKTTTAGDSVGIVVEKKGDVTVIRIG